MYKIEVRHSHIKINDYNQGDCPALEKPFRIWNPGYHRVEYHHIKFDKDNHCLYLPRGMDVFFIERCLKSKAYFVPQPSNYTLNSKIGMKFPPRDEKQSETLKFLLGANEYRMYKNYSQYLVALSPGVGKTYVSTAYIAATGLKAMVISYNLSDQWMERVRQYTDILPQEIYNIQGGPSIVSLFKKTPEQLSKYKVYLATHDTLKALMDRDPDGVNKLFAHLGIGVKIFDEAHKQFEAMCNIDYATDTLKTIYLTATPVRNDSQENDIYMTYFKNVPKISLFDDTDKHVKYVAMRYTSNPTLKDMDMCMSKYGFNRNIYSNYVVTKPEFYNMLRIILDEIQKMPGKKLMYLASNEAIKIVYDWIQNDMTQWYYHGKVGIYTSINKNKGEALKKELILTTSGSAGEGLDVPGLICGINLADPTKSEPLNRQRFERVRARGYFIDVIDEGFRTLINYYYANQKIYANFALSTQQIFYKPEKIERELGRIASCNPIPSDALFGECRRTVQHEHDMWAKEWYAKRDIPEPISGDVLFGACRKEIKEEHDKWAKEWYRKHGTS